ncbi:MAG: hypothetical protein RL266_2113 [Bacteroidota bacterium]|jgi:hypothetical protein
MKKISTFLILSGLAANTFGQPLPPPPPSLAVSLDVVVGVLIFCSVLVGVWKLKVRGSESSAAVGA